MNNSQSLLAAIDRGQLDDATVSAALDAIREDRACSVLEAVLTVATAWRTTQDAHELFEATGYMSANSPLREELAQLAAAECVDVDAGTAVSVIVVEGDQRPVTNAIGSDGYEGNILNVSIIVGARWVKREACRLMIERERAKHQPRTRRAK